MIRGDDPTTLMPRVLGVTQLLLNQQRVTAGSLNWLRAGPRPIVDSRPSLTSASSTLSWTVSSRTPSDQEIRLPRGKSTTVQGA